MTKQRIFDKYLQLTEQERDAVDAAFLSAAGGGLGLFQHFNKHGIVLTPDTDRLREALSVWVVASRGLAHLPAVPRPLGDLLREGGTQ
jgi:hypothetical protein